MTTEEMVTESKKAQKVKIVKCAVCSESFENKILETYQSSNIKCPKCKSYFLPKSQEQSKIGKYEKKNKKSSKLIKFFNARTGTGNFLKKIILIFYLYTYFIYLFYL